MEHSASGVTDMDHLDTMRPHLSAFVLDTRDADDVIASGIWINESGETRLALSPDGRYDKMQGRRQSTYSGRYACDGSTIRFIDDFDFVLTGEIIGDVLRIGTYVYRRA
ncbi:MAG: Atu4866 domain-containing protein [Rhodospirillaceae bacterium]|nr:Atu4866 domain-containing protein [Rhodospirillaceae bacterium]